MVPATFEGGDMEPKERYRRLMQQRPHGCLQLVLNPEQAVENLPQASDAVLEAMLAILRALA